VEPARDVVEAVVVGDIENDECASGAAIVPTGHRAEELLPGCVPQLQLDPVLLGLKDFGHKFDTEGGLLSGSKTLRI
jgi:hypothetical protein